MASSSASAPTVFKSRKAAPKLQPLSLKVDVHMRQGQLLLSADEAAQPLERLLCICRATVALLVDMLRPSTDASDAPVTILGTHMVTVRELGTATDGCFNRLHVQEICTFEQDERPKEQVKVQGNSLVTQHLIVDPTARAKAHRLGKDTYVKLHLGARMRIVLHHYGEEYQITLPALVLHDPMSGECVPDFKGPMVVFCAATGLKASLNFRPGGKVKGVLEQKGKMETYTCMGSFAGQWRGIIAVACPGQASEGIVYDGTGLKPAPVQTLNLRQLGPQQLPRLWTALHDALLYNDPANSVGGKGGTQVSRLLARSLKAMFLEPLTAHDTPAEPAGKQDEASEDDDIDDDARGAGADMRAVPPSYKAEHAQGNKLRYQLHYRLVKTAPQSAAAGPPGTQQP